MVWMYTTFAALPAFTHVGSSLDCAPFRAFKIGRPFSVYVHASSFAKISENCLESAPPLQTRSAPFSLFAAPSVTVFPFTFMPPHA